jgi:ketosteroid isomerase-like protein
MRRLLVLAAAFFVAAPAALPLPAQSLTPEAPAILHMLHRQAEDWNRGDLNAFAAGYKNSPDILFIGHTLQRGYTQMLDAYRKSFPTREAMGTLDFTGLEVQPLDAHFATVTGHFHLERTAAGGGDASGHFLLVLEKTSGGWKIVRDDTTDDPKHP